MARQRKLSFTQLLAQGAGSLYNTLASRGIYGVRADAVVLRRYTDASLHALEQVRAHAKSSRTAARAISRGAATGRQISSAIPLNPLLGNKWRYTVEVTFTNPSTGETMIRVVSVESTSPLDRADLARLGFEGAQDLVSDYTPERDTRIPIFATI